MIPIELVPLALGDLKGMADRAAHRGLSYGHLAVRRMDDGRRLLELLLLDRAQGRGEILSASVPDGVLEYPSIVEALPAAHWAERAIGDFWGLRAVGHPRWKSLILHDAWSADEFPLAMPSDGKPQPRKTFFMAVKGSGVHEIPVGPIHAGIIEPGHFRFSCLGEVVANLELQLGYQHRGVESRLTECGWEHARHLAEAVSGDTVIANALAHAEAIEGLWGVQVPPRAAALRTISLEIERLANHLGDLGALASDVGFAVAAAGFAKLRGSALGMGESLAGSRFQKGFVCPGGVAFGGHVGDLRGRLEGLLAPIEDACGLMFESAGVIERMEGVGVLTKHLADEFGIVGPAARASGIDYDARRCFGHGLYPALQIAGSSKAEGDVLARALVRRSEIRSSLQLVAEILDALPEGPLRIATPERLPPHAGSIGLVESWRGEMIHWVSTDGEGRISRYAIRDPSFQNWTGVAIAVRRNLVADFPLINKSFNLSYSGNDL